MEDDWFAEFRGVPLNSTDVAYFFEDKIDQKEDKFAEIEEAAARVMVAMGNLTEFGNTEDQFLHYGVLEIMDALERNDDSYRINTIMIMTALALGVTSEQQGWKSV